MTRKTVYSNQGHSLDVARPPADQLWRRAEPTWRRPWSSSTQMRPNIWFPKLIGSKRSLVYYASNKVLLTRYSGGSNVAMEAIGSTMEKEFRRAISGAPLWISTRRGHNHLPRDLVKPHDPTLRPHRWCTNEPTMAASVLTQRPARRSSFLWSRHTRVDVQGDLGGSGFITEAKDPGQMRLSWQQRSLLRFFEVCCDRACGLLRGKGRIRWMGPTWRWQEIHVNLTVRGACDEAWETSPWAPRFSRVVERKMKGIRWVDGCLIGPFSERRGRSRPRGMRAREAGKVRYTFFFISSFLFLFKFYFFLVQISNSS